MAEVTSNRRTERLAGHSHRRADYVHQDHAIVIPAPLASHAYARQAIVNHVHTDEHDIGQAPDISFQLACSLC
jgi:hypothetical protein